MMTMMTYLTCYSTASETHGNINDTIIILYE